MTRNYYITGGTGVLATLVLLFLISFPLRHLDAKNPDRYGYKVEKVYSHDRSSYTQGLFVEKGVMYESAGRYGASSFRKVDIAAGRVLSDLTFGPEYFLEGSCVLNGMLYILTWNEGVCFVYDLASMTPLAQIRYSGEGWGLTTDGKRLIMSDGSDVITFRDPATFAPTGNISVTRGGQPLRMINELEYINGKIWANVYLTEQIVIIDPETGNVEGEIDLKGIYPQSQRPAGTDVMNGIAYDRDKGKIYVTGKLWPKLFEITVFKK